MTYPTANDLDLDLPMAVQGVTESPVVMRIGTVANIVEADNITVRISGSPVLVTASYSFPQYQPLAGDRVVVIRQDAQWFVVGTMSGPNHSALLNSGFELGTPGAVPSNWTATTGSTAAGTIGFTKFAAPSPLDGAYVGQFYLPITGTGISFISLVSDPVPVTPGQVWTGGFFWRGGFSFGNYAAVSWGVGWYDNAGALVAFDFFGDMTTNSETTWTFQRPDTVGAINPSYAAPAGAVSARMEFGVTFSVPVATPVVIDSYLHLDRMILRQVS